MQHTLAKKLVTFILLVTMLVGTIPTVSFASTNDEGDIINVTNGKAFTLRKEYYDLLTTFSSFGNQDYIIYPWEGKLFIWFFKDDLTDVKFSMWNRSGNFGLNPSKDVAFTEYIYKLDTLEFIQVHDVTIHTSNGFNYSYNFMASFDIYTDKTYSTYFYEAKNSYVNTLPQPEEGEDVVNVTNGKTFTLESKYYDLLKSQPLYGVKDFIAYPWENYFYIWFFSDDLEDVKFSMWNRGTYNFGLYPSKNVSFIEYVYDRNTLEFIKAWDRTINTSNAYNYGYNFMASFNIYTNKTYSAYFYEAKNSDIGDDEPLVTFEPLEPNEAKEFLEYISNAGILVDVEKELPEYYNLLTGNIQNPNEELQTKVSFLTYLYYCLDAQLAQSNERIEMGTSYLIDWIRGNTETSSIIYSEIKDSLVDSLKSTIAQNATLPAMQLAGLNIATAVIDYGDLFIVSVGSFKALTQKEEILYLNAYKRLLEAKASGDELAIFRAEIDCANIDLNRLATANIERSKRFAEYIFNIENSLPV